MWAIVDQKIEKCLMEKSKLMGRCQRGMHFGVVGHEKGWGK